MFISPLRSGLGLGGTYPGSNFTGLTPCKENQVLVPSDMVAFGDVLENPMFEIPEGHFGPSLYESPASATLDLEWNKAMAKRHNGLIDTVFCDGHVESIKPKNLVTNHTDGAIQRWNKDHQSHRELWPTWWPKQ